MIDIKSIRDNPEIYKRACVSKNYDVDIERLLEIDSALLSARKKLQDIATTKNKLGKSIPQLEADKKKKVIGQLSELKEEESGYQDKIKELEPQFDTLMLHVPQPPAEDVPPGADDTENVEIRREGTVR